MQKSFNTPLGVLSLTASPEVLQHDLFPAVKEMATHQERFMSLILELLQSDDFFVIHKRFDPLFVCSDFDTQQLNDFMRDLLSYQAGKLSLFTEIYHKLLSLAGDKND